MEFIRNNMAARATDLRLYLDFNPDHPKFAAAHADPNNQPIMIFLKWFDCSRQTLLGQGKVFVNRHTKVSDLSSVIQEKMGWPSSTPIKLYEEIKAGMIEGMKVKQTFQQNEIQDGDIITYQVDISEKEVADLEAQSLYSSVPQIYDFLQNRVLVQFKPRYDDNTAAPEFDLMLSKKMTYDVMAHRVGDYLKHDPLKLRFTSSNPTTGMAKQIIKRALNQSVADITQTNYYSTHPNVVLFYELLDISIIELETKKSLKVIWTGRSNREETTHSFLLPKTSTFNDVADQLSRTVKLQPGGTGKIRIFDITNNGRSQRELTASEMIGHLPDPAELYAEEIPADELSPEENAKVVNLFHYSRDPTKTHGVPCKFVLREGEVFADTKKRIQERIGASDKDFAKFKFALVQSTMYKQPSAVEEGEWNLNISGWLLTLHRRCALRPQVGRRGRARSRPYRQASQQDDCRAWYRDEVDRGKCR
jgi:ubiquitin carboxyl-terminal hydrolase 7